MGVFSSLVQSGNTLDLVRLDLELDSKLPSRRLTPQYSSTVVNMSSATEAERIKMSVSGIEDDELIIVEAGMMISGTLNEGGYCILHKDNVALSGFVFTTQTFGLTSTIGNAYGITTRGIIQDASGAFDIQLKWARFTGSNPIYSAFAYIDAYTLKRRA